MDIDWLHKIPRLDVGQTARACLTRSSDRTQMPSHAGFFYPKKGGFQRIFDAIADPIRDQIVTSSPVASIENTGDILLVNGRYRAEAVINTAPWHALIESPIFDTQTRQSILDLKHNQIVVSLHAENYNTDAHWLYQPDEKLNHHRSFFINNFAPHSAPNGIYRETNIKRWKAGGDEVYSEINPYAYPIPTLGWSTSIDRVLAKCNPIGVHGLGRWGQWQYFNSDVCIYEAMRLVKKLGHFVTVPRI
jgi:protoporphyrinogen oxidase